MKNDRMALSVSFEACRTVRDCRRQSKAGCFFTGGYSTEVSILPAARPLSPSLRVGFAGDYLTPVLTEGCSSLLPFPNIRVAAAGSGVDWSTRQVD